MPSARQTRGNVNTMDGWPSAKSGEQNGSPVRNRISRETVFAIESFGPEAPNEKKALTQSRKGAHGRNSRYRTSDVGIPSLILQGLAKFHFSYPIGPAVILYSVMEKSEDVELVKDAVIALERGALDRWGKGDPEGYLEINAHDVTYFDPFVPHRLDGIAALKAWYEPIRGQIQIDSDEIIDPAVQVIGEVAILTIHYVSHGSEGAKRWNCTEVYRRSSDGWRIVHSHWSFAPK